MAATYPEYIWQNGRIKPWAEATVHVMAHALHYGSSVFEGIRSYETPQGPAIFRLGDHLKRLYMSAKIYDIAIPYTIDELAAACREVILKNGLTKAYLRPVAFRGLGGFGLSAETPTDVAVATWEMGRLFWPGRARSRYRCLRVHLEPDGSQHHSDRRQAAAITFPGNSLPAKRVGSVLAKASRWPRTACSAKVLAKTCSSSLTASCAQRRRVPRSSMASPGTR